MKLQQAALNLDVHAAPEKTPGIAPRGRNCSNAMALNLEERTFHLGQKRHAFGRLLRRLGAYRAVDFPVENILEGKKKKKKRTVTVTFFQAEIALVSL